MNRKLQRQARGGAKKEDKSDINSRVDRCGVWKARFELSVKLRMVMATGAYVSNLEFMTNFRSRYLLDTIHTRDEKSDYYRVDVSFSMGLVRVTTMVKENDSDAGTDGGNCKDSADVGDHKQRGVK